MQDLSLPNIEAKRNMHTFASPSNQNSGLRQYIDHVENGLSLRRIAKRDGVHASTVLRRIRKIESRRDDPLLDDALTRISQRPQSDDHRKEICMNAQNHNYSQEKNESGQR